MNLVEYCGNSEYSIVRLVFSITEDTREKIKKRKLIYKEQIIRYVNKQIELYFRGYTFKQALLQTYKYQVYNSVMFKLNPTLKEHIIFQCI